MPSDDVLARKRASAFAAKSYDLTIVLAENIFVNSRKLARSLRNTFSCISTIIYYLLTFAVDTKRQVVARLLTIRPMCFCCRVMPAGRYGMAERIFGGAAQEGQRPHLNCSPDLGRGISLHLGGSGKPSGNGTLVASYST